MKNVIRVPISKIAGIATVLGLLSLQPIFFNDALSAPVAAQYSPDCGGVDLEESELVFVDMSMVRSNEATEWVEIEKLVPVLTGKLAGQPDSNCRNEVDQIDDLRMYVEESSEYALNADTRLRIFGFERTNRPGPDPLRIVALPRAGAATLDTLVDDPERLSLLLSSLGQIRMVAVPRLEPYALAGVDPDTHCYRASGLTLVPSRVFDEELMRWDDQTAREAAGWPADAEVGSIQEKLAHVAGEIRFQAYLRQESELNEPCDEDLAYSFTTPQIRSLRANVERLAGRDLIGESMAFWSIIEQRVQRLRDRDLASWD